MKENNPPQIDCRIEHCTRPPKYDLNDNSFEQRTYLTNWNVWLEGRWTDN